MAWIYLFVAGLFEVFWAVGLKLSNGFSQPVINVITVLGMIASFYFLSLSLKEIPLGNAYAIWTGIGTVGTLILGIILFGEQINILRILCVTLILFGITGLKLLQ